MKKITIEDMARDCYPMDKGAEPLLTVERFEAIYYAQQTYQVGARQIVRWLRDLRASAGLEAVSAELDRLYRADWDANNGPLPF
jgi:hypothetical protein